MKFKYSLLLLVLLVLLNVNTGTSQVSINSTGTTPDPSAMLDITSEEAGMLIPRMEETQRLAISSPATGLLLYQTNELEGFYYWDGVRWLFLTASDGQGWSQTWQVFGEMYESSPNGTDYQLTSTNYYYGWSSATPGDVSGSPYVIFEDDPTADKITIGADGEGVYLMNISISFWGTNNSNIEVAVFKNGTLQPEFQSVSTISGNDKDGTSMSGILSMYAGDYIQLAFHSQGNSDHIYVMYCNLSLSRISLF